MVTGEKPLFVSTCYMGRAKVFSLPMSLETRTLMLGAPSATRFVWLTEAPTVTGMRKAKH